MLYSVFYKIENRDEYFERFFEKYKKQLSVSYIEVTREKMEDLMETLVQMIINKDKEGLLIMLTRSNTKTARTFFNYLTCSNIRNSNKDVILSRLDEVLD